MIIYRKDGTVKAYTTITDPKSGVSVAVMEDADRGTALVRDREALDILSLILQALQEE